MTLLELQAVSKRYSAGGEEVRAVDGVSIALQEGEMLSIQGPSGSGKTTLLLLIATLLAPDEGTVCYRGRSLASFSEAEASRYLRRDIGFVYQGFRLMPQVSALENAALKPMLDGVGPRKARALARPWLHRLGLGDRLDHTPEQLSGGERQRLAIARALTGEPPLVLADEPTANLDSARSLETVGLLRELAHERGTGVVLVTHDSEAAALADRCCVLRDGRVAQVTSTAVA
jgi:putative ABC transport system ATP-binding protein